MIPYSLYFSFLPSLSPGDFQTICLKNGRVAESGKKKKGHASPFVFLFYYFIIINFLFFSTFNFSSVCLLSILIILILILVLFFFSAFVLFLVLFSSSSSFSSSLIRLLTLPQLYKCIACKHVLSLILVPCLPSRLLSIPLLSVLSLFSSIQYMHL